MTMLPATTILLVRHGDVDNPERVFYGRQPGFGLSDLGREQAAAVAGALAGQPAAPIYTSPLLRARSTADIIAERCRLEVVEDEALNEVRSSWSGAPQSEIPIGVNLYEPPRGRDDETLPELADRVLAFLETVRRRHAGETICCVSHGDPIAVVWAHLRGEPARLIHIRGLHHPKQCAVVRTRWDEGGASVELWDPLAENAHLRRRPREAAPR